MNTALRLIEAQPTATKQDLIDTAITLYGTIGTGLDGRDYIKFPDGSSIKFSKQNHVKTWGMLND